MVRTCLSSVLPYILGEWEKIETALCLEKVQLNECLSVFWESQLFTVWCLDSISKWPKGVIKSGNQVYQTDLYRLLPEAMAYSFQ